MPLHFRRYLHIAIILVVLATVGACHKDGNAGYASREVITVEGINASYEVNAGTDSLHIDPVVYSSLPDASLRCFWALSSADSMPAPAYPGLDTIALTRSLHYNVKAKAGKWNLYFCVQNRNTTVLKVVVAKLWVKTIFTQGWYVVKNENGYTDLDLFTTPVSPVPNARMENLMELVNKRKLTGDTGSLALLSSYYYSPGLYDQVPTRTLFLWSNKDLVVLDAGTCAQIKDFNELFYATPTQKKVQLVAIAAPYYFLINNGRLRSIIQPPNRGRFGDEILYPDLTLKYQLAPYCINNSPGTFIFFDELRSCFLLAAGKANELFRLSDDRGTEMPSCGNNKSLLYLGQKSPNLSWAVLQDKTNPALKMLTSISILSSVQIALDNDTLLPASALYNARVFATVKKDENLLYFGNSSGVWSRDLGTKAEQLLCSLPPEEKLVLLKHVKYVPNSYDPSPYAHNYIAVGSVVQDRYKVRFFTKNDGVLSASPVFTLEGKGRVSDLLFVAPAIDDLTSDRNYYF